MREANIPKAGYVFQHKEKKGVFARVLYLAEGESLDDYKQITEAKFKTLLEAELAASMPI